MKWENGEKEREGEERKAGRSSLAGQTRESLPRRLRWSLFYGTERNSSVTLFRGTEPLTLRSNRWPHTDLDSCWVLPGEESVYKQYSNVTNKNYSCFPANQVSSDSW